MAVAADALASNEEAPRVGEDENGRAARVGRDGYSQLPPPREELLNGTATLDARTVNAGLQRVAVQPGMDPLSNHPTVAAAAQQAGVAPAGVQAVGNVYDSTSAAIGGNAPANAVVAANGNIYTLAPAAPAAVALPPPPPPGGLPPPPPPAPVAAAPAAVDPMIARRAQIAARIAGEQCKWGTALGVAMIVHAAAIGAACYGIYIAITKKDDDTGGGGVPTVVTPPFPIIDVSQTATRATTPTDLDVIAANETQGKISAGDVTDIKLYGMAMEDKQVSVSAPDGSRILGTWSIVEKLDAAGKATGSHVIRFSPNGIVREAAVTNVVVKYTLVKTDGTVSELNHTATLNFNLTPVAVPVGLMANSRTDMPSQDAVTPAFSTDAANAKIELIDSTKTPPANVSTLIKSGIGTWSVSGKLIQFKADAAFTGTADKVNFQLTDANGTSNQAVATVTLPPVGVPPPIPAADITISNQRRAQTDGNDKGIEVPVALSDTTSLTLIGNTGAVATTVTAMDGANALGTWSITVDNNVLFTPNGIVRTVDSVNVKYQLTNTNKVVSGPGTITINFDKKPVAASISKAGNRGDVIRFDILDAAYLDPTGTGVIYVYLYLDATTKDPNTVQSQGQYTWTVKNDPADRNKKWIEFQADAKSTFAAQAIDYEILDHNGVTSNKATLTAQVTMPMATGLMVPGAMKKGKKVVANIAFAARSAKPIDPASVVLEAHCDFGQTDVPDAIGMRNDRKLAVVPNEGVWEVNPTDATISFTPIDDTITQVTPMAYRYSDTSGVQTSPGIVLIDVDSQYDASLATFIKQTDSQYWADFDQRIIHAVPAIDRLSMLHVIQGQILLTHRASVATLTYPLSPAGFDQAYVTWKKKASTMRALFALASDVADDASKTFKASKYAARFWRLTLMANMIAKKLDEDAASQGN